MKLGVIGTGSMGRNHVRVISEIAQLVGVCDSDRDVGMKIAAKFGTRYCSDPAELLNWGVEGVSIVTPTSTHFETASKMLDAGVHVILEKPATGSPEKLVKLSELAEKRGVVLAVGFIERHNPVVRFAKKNLIAGSFGSFISAYARRVSSFPMRIRDVGVIMDLAVHDMDVIRYLVSAPVARVYATSGKVKNEEFEDHANVIMEFENDVTGSIEVNWLTPSKVRNLALTCSEQFVELDYMAQTIDTCSGKLREFDPENLFDLSYEFHERHISLKKEEPLKLELDDFISACSGASQPLVTAPDAVKTLELADATIRSASTGQVVDL